MTEVVRADKIFFGGDIFTLEGNCLSVEAMAVSGNIISALGSLAHVLEFVGESTEFIFLNKMALFPGFIEAHQHAILRAVLSSKCIDIGAFYCNTADEVMQKIHTVVTDALSLSLTDDTTHWCIFYGWDAELFPNLPKLSADYINTKLSAVIPIIIATQSFHCSWVNDRVIQLIDKDVCRMKEGEDGKFTGQVIEGNLALIYRALSLSECEMRECMLRTWRDYSSRGFTTVTELAYAPEETTDKVIKEIAMREDCPIRLALYQSGDVGTGVHKLDSPCTDKLWLAGVKLWADGSPHTGTLAVREPLLHSVVSESLSFPPPPNYGALKYANDIMKDRIQRYHDAGVQVAVHAQGERAIEQVLSIYEQVDTTGERRHRLEHLGLATEQQLARCGHAGLALSLFVYHLYVYGRTLSEYILGKERTDRWAPLATAIKYNSYISIHQDTPAISGPPLPLRNIQTAVTRCDRGDREVVYGADQCISVHEAIKAYTVAPAWQLFMEDRIGSLKVGKFADFVILSENPYSKSPHDIGEIRIVETYCNGRSNNNTELMSLKVDSICIFDTLK